MTELTRKRALQAVVLRQLGETYRKIGEEFGVSKNRGYQLVKAGERILRYPHAYPPPPERDK